jgi:flagellar hook-length control protein FliK
MFINSIFLPKSTSEQIPAESNPIKSEGFSTLFSDLFKLNFEKPVDEAPAKIKSQESDDQQENAISFVNISVLANKNIQNINKNISDIISEVLIGQGKNLLVPENSGELKSEGTPTKTAKIFAVSKDEFISEIRNVLKSIQLKKDPSSANPTLTIESGGKTINIDTSLKNLPEISRVIDQNLEGSETFKLLFKSDKPALASGKKEISVEVTPVTIKPQSTSSVKNLKQVLSDTAGKVTPGFNNLNIKQNEATVEDPKIKNENKTSVTSKMFTKSIETNNETTIQQPGTNNSTTENGKPSIDKTTLTVKQSKINPTIVKNAAQKNELLNDLFKKTETKEIIVGTGKTIKTNNIKQVVNSENNFELAELKPGNSKVKTNSIQNPKLDNQPELFQQPDDTINQELKFQNSLTPKVKTGQKISGMNLKESLPELNEQLPKTGEQKFIAKPNVNKDLKVSNPEVFNKEVTPEIKTQQLKNSAWQIDSNEPEIRSEKLNPELPDIKSFIKSQVKVKNGFVEIVSEDTSESELINTKLKPINVASSKENKPQVTEQSAKNTFAKTEENVSKNLVDEKVNRNFSNEQELISPKMKPINVTNTKENEPQFKDQSTRITSAKTEEIFSKNSFDEKANENFSTKEIIDNKSNEKPGIKFSEKFETGNIQTTESEDDYEISAQMKNEKINIPGKTNEQKFDTKFTNEFNPEDKTNSDSAPNKKITQSNENAEMKNSKILNPGYTVKAAKDLPVVEISSDDQVFFEEKVPGNGRSVMVESNKSLSTTEIQQVDQINPKPEKQVWVKVVVEEKEGDSPKTNETLKTDIKQVKSDKIENTNRELFQKYSDESNDTPKGDQFQNKNDKTEFVSQGKNENEKPQVENINHQSIKPEIVAASAPVKTLVIDDKKSDLKSPHVIEKTKVLSANELLKEVYKVFETGEKQTVVLKLVPKELGAIKITLDTFDNQLTAKVEVNNESVGHLMKSNVESLKQNLLQNGVQLNSINISFANSEHKQPGLNQQRKRNQNYLYENDIEINEELMLPKRMGYNTYEFLA